MPPRVGLLGGTFDPPHVGHLVVAEICRVALELDEVRFVVAGEPWMKERVTPAEHRCAMVERAIGEEPAFVLDRSEIDRAGPTYTIDTLELLRERAPEADLYFIAGADAIAKLPKWHEAERCVQLATFVAVTRPGYPVELEEGVLRHVEELEVPAMEISSTDLRRRFAAGDAVRYQLPLAVEAYVREHGLYGAAGVR